MRPLTRLGGFFVLCVVMLVASIAATHHAFAQTTQPQGARPLTDSLIREDDRRRDRLRRQLDRRGPKLDGPTVTGGETPAPQKAEAGGAKFKLNKIIFGPSAFIARDELAAAAAPFVGREIELADLYKIVSAVNAIYAERKIITALATLPPQKIKDGVVKIKLIEGRFGVAKFAGAKTLDPSYVTNRVDVPAGVVLDPPRLNKKISYFNRTNSAQIRALLQPGSTFGQTDIQYAVFEPATNTFQIFADNQGVESTGEYQIGGFFRRYGLFGMDDRLTVYATNARETINANVAYNMPVDKIGSRLGLSYSRGVLGIVDGPFVALDIAGTSQSGSLNYTRPIVVTDNWLIQASASMSLGESETTYSNVRVTKTDTAEFNPGLSFNFTNDRLSFQISPSIGFFRSQEDVLDTKRDFVVFKGTGAFSAALPHLLRMESSFSWQSTPSRLLPGGQLFQAGGPTTVRGYATNAAAGDEGYLVSVEFHRELVEAKKGLNIFAFIDHAGLFSTAPSFRQLTSIGAGIDVELSKALKFEFALAHPLTQITPDQDDLTVYARVSFTPEW